MTRKINGTQNLSTQMLYIQLLIQVYAGFLKSTSKYSSATIKQLCICVKVSLQIALQ